LLAVYSRPIVRNPLERKIMDNKNKVKKFVKNGVKALPWALLIGAGATLTYVHIKYRKFVFVDLSPEIQNVWKEDPSTVITCATKIGNLLVTMEP
jgi:hypothetical protein